MEVSNADFTEIYPVKSRADACRQIYRQTRRDVEARWRSSRPRTGA